MEILVRDAMNKAVSTLREAGVLDCENDSWLLAEHVFGITRQDYYINPYISVDKSQADRYFMLVKKRAKKIPLQHITGTQEFMGYTFKVNENVLVPRQDTELLVEKAVEYIQSLPGKVKVLDLCTGSGCIAISVDKMCRNAEVMAADISHEALAIARENNVANNAKVEFVNSNLFDEIQGKFDVIVSNPPYIKTGEIDTLMEEVKDHEPLIALDGDDDGLKFYRLIARRLGEYLKDDGFVMFEIGYDQGKSVPEILKKYGFHNIKVLKDLSKNDRVVIAGKE